MNQLVYVTSNWKLKNVGIGIRQLNNFGIGLNSLHNSKCFELMQHDFRS